MRGLDSPSKSSMSPRSDVSMVYKGRPSVTHFVTCCSSPGLYIRPCPPLASPLTRKHAAGNNGEKTPGTQPPHRADYVKYMRGVDVADQRNAGHDMDHRPLNYYWRRPFHNNKVAQADTNAHVAMLKWASNLLGQVQAEIAARFPEGGKVGGATGAAEHDSETVNRTQGSGLRLYELEHMQEVLTRWSKVERCAWDTALSRALQLKCEAGGNTVLVGPRLKIKRPSVGADVADLRLGWRSGYMKNARRCISADCYKKSRGVCACTDCAGHEIIMCQTCALDYERHKVARESLSLTRKNGDPRSRKRVKRDRRGRQ